MQLFLQFFQVCEVGIIHYAKEYAYLKKEGESIYYLEFRADEDGHVNKTYEMEVGQL